MNKKTLLSGLLLCLSALQLHAQGTPKSGGPDARLTPGLSGDGNQGSVYSPNLFNGTANITVPIYSNGDKGISLSYNTAGVKVDELSGVVGLHWSLNTGGSITRVMKDVPDEMNLFDGTAYLMGSGNVSEYTIGVKGKWARYFGEIPDNDEAKDNARYMDDESDDFIFSVGGLSFTFNIGKDGFVFTNPHTNIKIDILFDGNPVTEIPLTGDTYTMWKYSFRVRDAQGNWYYFTQGDISHKEYTSSDFAVEFNYVSKWVIQKFVSNTGKEINYTYNDLSYSGSGTNYTNMYSSFTAEERSGVPVPQSNILKSDALFISSKQIASISYPDNKMATFVYAGNSGSRCDDPTNNGTDPVLREIQIKEGSAGTRYILDQAYSLAPYSGSTIPNELSYGSACYDISTAINDDYRYHRLILKGLHIASMDGNTTEPYYSFTYNTTVRLPARFSGAQDYYGYYNGVTVTQNQGTLSIPYHTPKYGGSTTAYGVDRNDYGSYISAGLLTSLTNASGGKTEFEYEPHQLSNVLSDAYITLPTDNYFYGAAANDGVRVKSVKTSDPRYPTIYTKQNYTYTGGQRFLPGGYFDYPLYTGTNSALFNSSFVSPHQFINGSNHGYTQVTIETKNNSSQLLSKRVTVFQNISTAPYTTSYYNTGSKQYFELPFTDKQYIKDWELGLPLAVTEYDQFENKVSVTTNTYTSLLDNTSAIGKIENLKILGTTDLNGANMTETYNESYTPYTGISLLTKTVSKKYINPTTYITDEVTYTYDERNNPETIVTTDSRGKTFTLKNIYNYNVSGTGVLYGGTPGTLHDMTDDGLEFKIGMERWKTSPTNSPYSDELYDASITKFQYQSGKILTKKLFTLRFLDPIGYSAYTGIFMGSPGMNAYGKILAAYNTTAPVAAFQQVSEVLQFDSKDNPIETKISDREIYKSMIWDEATGDKVADVSNARRKDIGFTSFEKGGLLFPQTLTDGGFTYNQTGLQFPTGPISGKAVFYLSASGYNSVITSPVLTSGVTYIMTFWVKNFAPNIAGAGLSNSNIEYTNIHNLNDWVQWQATFTPTANGSISFTTTQPLYIDEIRLFPKGAQMTNAVYAPMLGVTSTTDAQGRITYYLYDALGRQSVVKDQDGNVISKQERHIAQ